MVIAIAFGCFVYVSNNTVAAAALENWHECVMAGEWVVLIAAEELLGTIEKVMSAIGASIGYFFTSASTLVAVRHDGDGTKFLKVMAIIGVIFSVIFMILQLIPIPGLSGVYFGKESYIMLIIWVAIDLVFYAIQHKFFSSAQ